MGAKLYSPVGTKTGNQAQIIVYNPDSTQLNIRCDFNGSSIAQTAIAGGASASFAVPQYSGAHCFAKTGTANGAGLDLTRKFFAISVVDSNYVSSSGGTDWDWGFTLIPDSQLAPQALVGLGLRQDPTKSITDNGSPLGNCSLPCKCEPGVYLCDVNGDDHYRQGGPQRRLGRERKP